MKNKVLKVYIILTIIIISIIVASIFYIMQKSEVNISEDLSDNINVESADDSGEIHEEDNKISVESADDSGEILEEDNEITVEPVDVMNDAYFVSIGFKISGLKINDQHQICGFKQFRKTLIENPSLKPGGSYGNFKLLEDGNIVFSVNLCINPVLNKTDVKFYDQTLHLGFSNLTGFNPNGGDVLASGNWEFDFSLAPPQEEMHLESEVQLEGMGYKVVSMDITPMSLYIRLERDGNPDWYPNVSVVNLSDGRETYITGGGFGADGIIGGNAYILGRFEYPIDVDQLEIINFSQEYKDDGAPHGYNRRYASLSLIDEKE